MTTENVPGDRRRRRPSEADWRTGAEEQYEDSKDQELPPIFATPVQKDQSTAES